MRKKWWYGILGYVFLMTGAIVTVYKAYETLSDPDKRAEYDRRDRK
jgi:hypothetical protein